jgi:cell wall-associated NlpC family hydrolase
MIRTASLIRAALLAAVFSAFFILGASAAYTGAGTVTADALRLRSEPSTSSDILATATKGNHVVVLEDAGSGWYKVDCDTIVGYMSGEHLTVASTLDASLGYAYIDTDGSTLNLRADAGTGSSKLASIPGRTVLAIEGIKDGWFKVSYGGKTGYISGDYVLLVQDTDGSRADGEGKAVALSTSNSKGAEIAAYAQNFLGCKYVYGGNGPNSFDCSGFTKYIYKQFGYTLNRTATNQLSNGVSVSMSELQPGDLVFFKYRTSKPVSHVGIYIGDGQFIHASTNAYKVQIDTLSSGHYYNVYVYGRRIV